MSMLRIWTSTYFVHNGELLQAVNTVSATQEHNFLTEIKRGTWHLIIFITNWTKALDNSRCTTQQFFEFLSLLPFALYLCVYTGSFVTSGLYCRRWSPIWWVFYRASSMIWREKNQLVATQWFYWAVWVAQHVSGIIMPIVRSLPETCWAIHTVQ